MKKCTLVLMIFFTILACKKGEVTNPAVKTNESNIAAKCDSLTLDDYNKLSDLNKKVEWLKKHGDSVCRKILDSTVLVIHEVKGKVINQKGKYPISWGKLKEKIGSHGYDAYLSVAVNKDEPKIDSLYMVPAYGDGNYCFSTALIRSLAKKYTKDENTKFEFSLAKTNEKSKPPQSVVVIQVNGTPYYYDYSTDPPVAPLDNKPL